MCRCFISRLWLSWSGQLRDVWFDAVSRSEKAARLDVLNGLGKTTLDVIGLAGMSIFRHAPLRPK